MPTISHEAPLAVFREAPGLVPTLLRDALGVDVPSFDEVELAEADLTQVVPTELRADLVLVLRGPAPARAPAMGIVVEVQRGRDERKRFTWPLYLAALQARLSCPTCLVVVATDEGVARWAGEPIPVLHPGVTMRPFVLGPAQVPRVDRAVALEQPWLAVLSALVHGNRLDGVTVAYAAVMALDEQPVPHAMLGIELIMATLDDEVRDALEVLIMDARKVPYDPPTEFLRKPYYKGREEGLEEGRGEGRLIEVRHMLQEVAARRLGELGEDQRARIEACADLASLERMLVEIAVAPDVAAVARVLEAG